jgi:hypothetical protein
MRGRLRLAELSSPKLRFAVPPLTLAALDLAPHAGRGEATFTCSRGASARPSYADATDKSTRRVRSRLAWRRRWDRHSAQSGTT